MHIRVYLSQLNKEHQLGNVEPVAVPKQAPIPVREPVALPKPVPMPKPVPTPKPVGPDRSKLWDCPSCSFSNWITRPGCEMCGERRPENVVVTAAAFADPEMPESERRRIDLEKQAELQRQVVRTPLPLTTRTYYTRFR